ncbi:YjcQ family protein [Stecheria sp. CLA-KB-P133]|uniref:YjcQ family protein n=1 Tax=Grylomicrobium aquisgranensis TaxID=2926318 RepID=A0AB35U6Q3_9FIRM|nr:YjcQ family protein [Stecheria sp. CLA-KB-P133]
MAKDDYYSIAATILVYLYARLKGKHTDAPDEYIHENSKEFPISREYLYFVINEVHDHGYVKATVITDMNGDPVLISMVSLRITQEGIDFLQNNSVIRKIINTIPLTASIFELFQ